MPVVVVIANAALGSAVLVVLEGPPWMTRMRIADVAAVVVVVDETTKHHPVEKEEIGRCWDDHIHEKDEDDDTREEDEDGDTREEEEHLCYKHHKDTGGALGCNGEVVEGKSTEKTA